MAKNSGGAIVIEVLLGDGDTLENARRLADATKSLNGSARRLGGQLRATTAGYISAVSKSVRAVEALRDEQIAAFGETAEAWESARTRLNGLSLSLGELKRSLRDAFVPILTAAAPALTTLTNLAASAVRTIGAFMAALTGQNAFIRATGEQRAYAGSLRRSASAAKALRRQLASFDELDILRDSRTGSGGSGGGFGGMEDLGGKLSLVAVDAEVIEFAKRLKQLFAAADYDGVGRAIADALNGAIEKARALIAWENVGTGVTAVVDGVCAAFNGLIDGVRWTEVGGTLGDGVDTLIRTANRLLAGVNFAGVGKAIGEGLGGAIRQIDFDLLGDTLGRLLTLKLTVAANAAASFDWQMFGAKLAEGVGGMLRSAGEALEAIDWTGLALSLTRGVNRLIADVDWAQAGRFLGQRLSEALGAMSAVVGEFDWQRAGDALSDAVNGLVKHVDWQALGRWLDGTIQGLLDFGIRFLEGFDADDLARGIGRALDEVDWDAIAAKLWKLLSTALSKLGGFWRLLSPDGLEGGALDGLTIGGKPAEAQVGVRLVKQGWTGLSGFVGTSVQVSTTLVKDNWTTIGAFVGTSVQVLTSLAKSGWTSLNGFVGDRVTALVGLAKSGWETLGGFVGTGSPLSALIGLVKSGWETLGGFVGTGSPLSAAVGLVKSGWETLGGFVGTGSPLSAAVGLVKSGWSTLGGFVGTGLPLSALIKLAKSGWSTLGGFVGTGSALSALVKLVKSGWSTLSAFVGTSVSVRTALQRWGWSSIATFVGEYVNVYTSLLKKNWSSIASYVGNFVDVYTALKKSGWSTLQSFVGDKVTARVTLVADTTSKLTKAIIKAMGVATGGVITAGGRLVRFASGGAVKGGAGRFWQSIPGYAGGTTRAHGTLFMAGESGPEIMGHINGRTEILNKSQLAQTMQAAVINGMVAAMSRVRFRMPVMATGAVTPYEVSAQIARADERLASRLDANNEDLIQVIVSVAAQIVGAIQAQPRPGATPNGGASAQQIIDEINRRTQMFSASPLTGV